MDRLQTLMARVAGEFRLEPPLGEALRSCHLTCKGNSLSVRWKATDPETSEERDFGIGKYINPPIDSLDDNLAYKLVRQEMYQLVRLAVLHEFYESLYSGDQLFSDPHYSGTEDADKDLMGGWE